MASTADLGKLKVDDFKKHLNASFEMQVPGSKAPVVLKLVEAASHGNELPKVLKTDKGEGLKSRDGGGFTLQFLVPMDARIEQGTYPIKHPELGTLEMFLTPTAGLVQGHPGCHAVFG
jgi:hypothetical protein